MRISNWYNTSMGQTKRTVIGILAHVDAGKTTLIESILYQTGAIGALGRVDHRDSFFDFDEQERNRGITIYSKEAHFVYKDIEVYIIDTPGHADFSSEMERTLSVLDMAILLINGQDGVQAHSETIWKCLEYYHIPTLVFVNKMDISYFTQEKLLMDIHAKLSGNCINWLNEDKMEEICFSSDVLLEQYESKGSLTSEEIVEGFYHRSFFPVFFGSALQVKGIDVLLEGIAQFSVDRNYPDDFGARVYKITVAENHTRLTHVKITGGILHAKQRLDEDEKVDQIRLYHGSKFSMLEEAYPGMVVALKGLEHFEAGDGLGFEEKQKQPILNAYMDYRLVYPKGTDLLVLMTTCREISDEDPALEMDIQNETGQIDVHIMGEMQMEVLQKRILDCCGISVGFSTGRILYRETIAESVKGAGHFEPLRHYAEVQVRLDPLVRGKGILIANETGSDQLSFNWQNAILSALRTKKHRGVLTGSELTDVKITLIAGKGHLKHTEGGDFRQAASRAVRQALMKTTSILLEPYVRFELTVPSEFLSKALFDLESKRAQFEIQDSGDGRSVIVGRGCIRLLAHYQNEVNAYSKGQGRFSFQPDGYDMCQDTDEIVTQIGYDPEMDMRNPSSSVFCANGSGFTVTWDQADEYMDIVEEKVESTSTVHRTYRIEEDELKRIFERSTSNNRNFNKQSNPIKKKPKEEKPKVIKHLPACLVVDGYNMIFSWDIFKDYKDEELAISREKLLDILFNYQAFTGEKMIVVFDGYKVKDNLGTIYSRKDMEVVYTSSNLTADAYIERFVSDHQKDYDITVASSDGLIQNAIFAQGAKRMSARELFGRITFINHEIEEQLTHS